MRILVLSDTHGDVFRARQVYDKLKKQGPVDLVIHCGDYYKDAIHLEEQTGAPVVFVKGNCDGSFSDSEYAIADTEYGSLLVTHGHMENVNFSQQNLFYRAQELGCAAAIFGHTHRAVCTDAGGIHLFNPGSLSHPRDGSGGTFGVITTGADYFQGRILRYEDFMKSDGDDDGSGGGPGSGGNPGNRKKVQGGYLRGLLNYSDRF